MRYRNAIVTVQVTTDTVRPGDVLTIGGAPFRVTDLTSLPGRGKLLHFETGETMTMLPRTLVAAVRTVPTTLPGFSPGRPQIPTQHRRR